MLEGRNNPDEFIEALNRNLDGLEQDQVGLATKSKGRGKPGKTRKDMLKIIKEAIKKDAADERTGPKR